MFLKHKPSGDIVEIIGIAALIDTGSESVVGRYHHGEEMQDEEDFAKADLIFPSGEALPNCWINANYRA